VANQTALIEAADSATRGSVMATRFGLVQTASILGTGVGGLITKVYSAEAAYGVLGVGLVMLALYAFAAGRSTVNPLHGRAYEEALGHKPGDGASTEATTPETGDGAEEEAAALRQATT
jgi:hypothetical protein